MCCPTCEREGKADPQGDGPRLCPGCRGERLVRGELETRQRCGSPCGETMDFGEEPRDWRREIQFYDFG